jgi:asparagine synthase (glutamine-hydrolysing)
MCGIAGEIARGRPANLAAVGAMTNNMVSRGPDSSGVWAREGVALGHRRLSIIDLSSSGHQPMHDPELGLTVVFNGCIYNYPELRRQLLARGTASSRTVTPRSS